MALVATAASNHPHTAGCAEMRTMAMRIRIEECLRRQKGADVRPFVQIWNRTSGSKSEDRGSRPRGPYQKI